MTLSYTSTSQQPHYRRIRIHCHHILASENPNHDVPHYKERSRQQTSLSTNSGIRTEDATHELNYKKIISMCCNLEVEQIDAAMLEVLLAAVESDDNGTGAIAPGSEPVVPPAPVLDTTMADVEGDDILAGLLDADQHQQVDAALDGLLFKVTSLSSI
ncbi:hypothetical protein BCR33DRAFT_422210 [Rhizoclosmatium globosum]|uniref:Uncharacterized protein n=1 Tax=Rhizoclosmatium globosum TaxID=329046 RepID=A0A1Y2BVQ1_9FUNG|nr:hypothetical protein BCR33DRAFT_422210 [Rhizoclosmatium globosum]|eukprot:ORY38852.1 hypothetical protein BCR33DRAFT_422210 [Rhizoclosmatium globosum]